LDIIFVCQKREQDPREPTEASLALAQTATLAREKLNRLGGLGLLLSRNDCRVTVVSQFLAQLGPVGSPDLAVDALTACQPGLEQIVATTPASAAAHPTVVPSARTERQLPLFSLPD
jgi:hypothetical protein